MRTVESLIPKLDTLMNAGFVMLLTVSIVKSDAISNSIADGWKLPYMSCKYSHAVDATELMARFLSPLGPTVTVSQVSIVGFSVG